MLKSGIFLFIFSYCSLCRAQNDSIIKSSGHPFNLKLSYNSSLIYPGISTGIEYPLGSLKNKEVIKDLQGKILAKDRLISGNINWYHHPGFHDNIYITFEWVMRRTTTKGFISEFSLGPGYSRTFLAGTTYRVSDNGNISVIKCAGYSYALVTLGGGFGYDFSVKKQLPFSSFAKMNIISMFPYNSSIYFRPVLELGFRYSPDHIKSKRVKK
jgi:hypothetical protein